MMMKFSNSILIIFSLISLSILISCSSSEDESLESSSALVQEVPSVKILDAQLSQTQLGDPIRATVRVSHSQNKTVTLKYKIKKPDNSTGEWKTLNSQAVSNLETVFDNQEVIPANEVKTLASGLYTVIFQALDADSLSSPEVSREFDFSAAAPSSPSIEITNALLSDISSGFPIKATVAIKVTQLSSINVPLKYRIIKDPSNVEVLSWQTLATQTWSSQGGKIVNNFQFSFIDQEIINDQNYLRNGTQLQGGAYQIIFKVVESIHNLTSNVAPLSFILPSVGASPSPPCDSKYDADKDGTPDGCDPCTELSKIPGLKYTVNIIGTGTYNLPNETILFYLNINKNNPSPASGDAYTSLTGYALSTNNSGYPWKIGTPEILNLTFATPSQNKFQVNWVRSGINEWHSDGIKISGGFDPSSLPALDPKVLQKNATTGMGEWSSDTNIK